jgi:hypothetical protein
MNLLLKELSSVRNGIRLRKASILFLLVVMVAMALAAALQYRFGEGQVSDISQAETKSRLVIGLVFGLIALALMVALIVYSSMCRKLLEPKELDGSQIVLSNTGKMLSLEKCEVLPLYRTSAMWPLNTVTVLVDGRVRAYVSVEILEETIQLTLLERWHKYRGLLPLRAQEYQEKVTPR